MRRQRVVLALVLLAVTVLWGMPAGAWAAHPDVVITSRRVMALNNPLYLPVVVRLASESLAVAPQVTSGVCAASQELALDAPVTGNNAGPGSTNVVNSYSCAGWDESGPEVAYRFSVAETQLVTVTLSNLTGDVDVFVLEERGGGCDSAGCLAFGDNQASFEALPGKTYYVVVDGFGGAVGDYTLTASGASNPSPAPAPMPEAHDVHIRLTWTQSLTTSPMLDLHLVRAGGVYWDDLNDAYYRNRVTTWGAMLAKNCSGWDCAQEDIFLDNPSADGAYAIRVYYWGPNAATVAPLVHVWFKGDLVPSFAAQLTNLTGDHTWHMGVVNWPDKTVTVENAVTRP